VHWAIGAQASSTYADRTQLDHPDGLLSLEVLRVRNSDRLATLCIHCHQDPHAQDVAPQQCPELVRSMLLLRGDRRQRIETLRQELQRLEQEEATEEQQQSILRETQSLLERMAAEQLQAADSNRIQQYEEIYRKQLEAQEAARALEAEKEAILRDLTKLRELEAARRAEAEAEAARLQAELQKRYEQLDPEIPAADGIRFVDPESAQGDAVVGSQKLLEELTRSVQQQQQAIDRLAQILEALRLQLQPADPESTEGETTEPVPESSWYDRGAGESASVELGLLLPKQDSANVDDAAFLRSVLLLMGVPQPTPVGIQEYLDVPSESKRQKLLEMLSEHNRRAASGENIPAEGEPSSD
jgi:hypothetical protein